MNSFQGTNTFQGTNPYLGTNTLMGTNSFMGDSSLSGVSSALLKPMAGTVDPLIAQMFGKQVVNKDGQQFYSGKIDPSSLQFGTAGYQTRDIGPGQYEILDAKGNPLGTGYKDLSSSITDYYHKVLADSIKPYDVYDENGAASGTRWRYGIDDPATFQDFNSKEEALAAAKNFAIDPRLNYYGPIGQWESLGQLLNGKLPVPHSWGDLATNNSPESITGLNTLYGSRPLLYKDKLLGYDINLAPGNKFSGGEATGNPMSVSVNHKGKSHAWSNNAYRELNDPSGWGKLVGNLGNGHVFVDPSKASQLPGWTNKDSYQRVDKAYDGGFGSAMQIIGTVLKFTPLAPLGYAMSAIDALSQNNPVGAFTSVLGGTGALGSLASSLSDATRLPSWASSGLIQGGLGGLGSLSQGGDFGKGFLGGSLGSLAGSGIGSLLGDAGAPSWAQNIGSSLGGSLVRQSAMGNKINPRSMAISSLLGGLNQYARSKK